MENAECAACQAARLFVDKFGREKDWSIAHAKAEDILLRGGDYVKDPAGLVRRVDND